MTILKTFEHKGKALQLADYAAPERAALKKSSSMRAPGAGKFQIESLTLSDNLTLSAQISGNGIAYLIIEILMKDEGGVYGPVLREYVPAEADKEVGGVKRPDWGETINLSIPLRPSLTLLTDGSSSAFAFASPTGYGVSGCYLDGQYTSAAEGSQTRVRIAFNGNGEIKEILAFKKQGIKSTPHALTPKPGDTFAPFVQVFTEEDGATLHKTETVLSTALTFGEAPFRLETEDLIPGKYLAVIAIQDLDGGFTRKYVPFTAGE
jgi:hypothetical protein